MFEIFFKCRPSSCKSSIVEELLGKFSAFSLSFEMSTSPHWKFVVFERAVVSTQLILAISLY